ncbi:MULTISPECIES: phosphotriesterase [Streptomyces]|uniref:Phosphotriesterase n=1 Tax=Streptomyces venezuelae TaxID=54571 RepID=A0A5P2BLD5_STRVZ|nr:phosphotriesterase [Streptomyces venezuelae]MYY87371.1 phosphotriesterase [Streptomyces sp. SID335]MYZ15451.1 phosphotriesterase [Streptomyces sp. SID337]NDZ89874.1 phosphotriesterase [Streptomyces sp. SID10115]NEA05595.1 phosphotriesterase [Streptomyces sp. SID10116]NEB47442.1 phosphotriesterase [Streptomyces sp. SID339]
MNGSEPRRADAPAVRTVLGDISPADLGVCDAHDHLFLRSPQLPGQELDSPSAAAAELAAFREAGGRSVIQWTPHGMGRRAGLLPELSKTTGVRVVAATGLHQAVHYSAESLEQLRAYGLAALFVRELTAGIGESGVRAGLIKVAGGFHGLDAHARWTMTAAAEAHHATGAPITVHLELGTGALDVLDLLCGECGVPPHRVVLGHLNRSPDLTAHLRAAESGAYVALDGPSRAHHATDWRMPDAVRALADAGFGDRLLLGGDTTTAGARSVHGGPGMPHLLRRVRPRLVTDVGEELVEQILTVNPGQAFGVRWT